MFNKRKTCLTVGVRCSCPTCHTDVTLMQHISKKAWTQGISGSPQTHDSCHVADPGSQQKQYQHQCRVVYCKCCPGESVELKCCGMRCAEDDDLAGSLCSSTSQINCCTPTSDRDSCLPEHQQVTGTRVSLHPNK